MTIQEKIQEYKAAKKRGEESGMIPPKVLQWYQDEIDKLSLQLSGGQLVVEKKNDSESSNVEQSAVATNADAQQQYSATKPSGNSLDVEVYPVSDDTDSISDKKWIGKAHKDSFKSISAFNRFMKIKHKLKTMLVNFLKMKDKEFNDASKKNAMTELSQELSRIVKNDVKKEYQKDLLERKFFVKNGKEKVFYGCNERLINDIFKTK